MNTEQVMDYVARSLFAHAEHDGAEAMGAVLCPGTHEDLTGACPDCGACV